MWSDAFIMAAAMSAGAVAAVTGFGIGSLLTPVLALSVDTRTAVAAVSIPHAVGTALRLWLLRGHADRHVLWSFGLTSAAGGLVGAALSSVATNRWLTALFGVLLLIAAGSEVTGLTRRLRFQGPAAWLAGALSGMLGGLVGNQGGIRSAALLGFDLPKQQFVGTATAIALFVDGARLPVYLATQGDDLVMLGPWIVLATIGVVTGTLVGGRALKSVPEHAFRRVLVFVLALLGCVMLTRASIGPEEARKEGAASGSACAGAGYPRATVHAKCYTRAALSAARTRRSLNGTRRSRTPVASKTALATAATVGLHAASPAP
jgi:uncharacterized membrane protein YfcA